MSAQQQQSRFVLRILLARASAWFGVSRLGFARTPEGVLRRFARTPEGVLRLLPAMAGLLMTGCNMILWGNLGVLAVAVGIFLGTVFLSRSSAASRSASRSLSPTSSGAGANSAADGTRS
jgi:hypothetical protein